ncbi:hypothetical protein OTU49_007651 [Cherax quadricarinatus]|uniref:Uncharacterized protein n=1 Tax=Cherax quadricarinatus TaxID=27406 RepID=A0AAW0WS99_CHEQU
MANSSMISLHSKSFELDGISSVLLSRLQFSLPSVTVFSSCIFFFRGWWSTSSVSVTFLLTLELDGKSSILPSLCFELPLFFAPLLFFVWGWWTSFSVPLPFSLALELDGNSSI